MKLLAKKQERIGETDTINKNLHIRMEFGIEKCVMLIKKSGKRQIMEEIELTNQERIRTHGEKENYSYLGSLEPDIVKPAGKDSQNQALL